MRRAAVALLATASLGLAPAASAGDGKHAVATGTGGAVTSVDLDASRVGLKVLRGGGNAVDAAVATAAALGVTEPYSAGIGGGGFFVGYDAKSGNVYTIDGREAAPGRFSSTTFQQPDGTPMDFAEAVTSGLSVGVPGTPATWQAALSRYGTRTLAASLEPAARLAERGFVVDRTFHRQTAGNRQRFGKFSSTKKLFLRGGKVPAVGAVFRNPDLAATYRLIGRRGIGAFYSGRLGAEIARTAQTPPTVPGVTVHRGLLTTYDLRRYTAPYQPPTRVDYRGFAVYGMGPPSSGGSTVGEALNILERFNLAAMNRAQAFHHYLEASRLAFADRAQYVGDPAFVRVPLRQLLSDGFARERACLIRPHQALPSPQPPGSPDGDYAGCRRASRAGAVTEQRLGSTTHLTVADRWGNVVSYTLTIEQTGGSGITVPGRGFLLNNELTDFNFTAAVPNDPNLPAPFKRPRSSMSPTIVFRAGAPYVALGSPGGSTIITTVLQILVEELDLGRSLPEAIAAPRASQRNSDPGVAEPAFLQSALGQRLQNRFGQQLVEVTPPPTFDAKFFDPEIGAATGIRFFRRGVLQAAAEPTRRGGGAALVVNPR
jgi:gamma-glutamyltranspeptidase/glutathione hydrolase